MTSSAYNVFVAFDRELIEAQLALNEIPSKEMPRIAWDALEANLDGPAIRRLAALERPTAFQVAEVLPAAMREMGLSAISTGEGALRIGQRRASEILEKGEDPLASIRDFADLWIRAGYPSELRSVGNLHDEIWMAELTGQSESEIRKWVIERLKAIVRQPGSTS